MFVNANPYMQFFIKKVFVRYLIDRQHAYFQALVQISNFFCH